MTDTPQAQTPPTPDASDMPDAPDAPDAAGEQTARSRGVSRPARIALVTAALVAVVLAGLWVVRGTPWTADATGRDSGDSGDSGIVEPGLTLYPAGDRDPSPPLQGRTLDDEAFNLEDLKSHVVVINVWGSWCGPCRSETPGLVRVANKVADKGVRFVGINTRDSAAGARAFVKNYNVPYPSVFDPAGQALLPFRDVIPSAAIPSSVILDRDGNVATRVIGAVDDATLAGIVDDLLAEDGTGGGGS